MRRYEIAFAIVLSVAHFSAFADSARVPENPTGTQPGIYYQYYPTSGTGGTLPNFASLQPILYGVINNFSLSPATSTTNFSFQYTGYVTVPTTGVYTFYTNSDDGSALYIGTTQVVSNNFSQGQTERSGTIDLEAGTHALTVQYGQGIGAYALSVSYAGPTITKTTIPDSALSTIPLPPPQPRQPENPTGTAPGLIYQFYTNTTTDGTLPVYTSITPALTGTINNFLLDPRTTDTDMAFQFKGYVTIPTTGFWTFYTSSDDGSRLFIGTTLVVDNDYSQGMTERSGVINLAAGMHAITVQYAQGGGGFGLTVSFQGPSGSNPAKEQIPDGSLTYLPLTATPAIAPANPKISTPTFQMSLSCATTGAVIYYTTDGTVPTTASAVYSTPQTLTVPVTINAYAKAPNYDYSFVATTSFISSNPPPNDNFANAILLSGTLPITTTGTNANATWETGEPNHGDGDGQSSIWYKWVAPTSACYEFSTAGSAIDTTMGIYTGTAVNALTTIGENDDQNDEAVNTLGLNAVTNSYIAFSAVAGTTYYIAIDGFGGAQGNVKLTISLGPVISVVASSPNASETGPTSGIFTISRTGDTSAAIQVNFALSGSATKGFDYIRIDEFTTLAAGQTSATVTITPIDNFISDGTRHAILTLSPDDNYSINAAQSTATVNIADNDPPASGTVSAVTFSVPHGFYSTPISVALSSTTPSASIRYTLDGTMPTPISGTLYTAPLAISSTTTLRAIAYKSGVNPTVVATQTYLFTADIINQSSTSGPPGWPSTWGANTVHYGMDPNIVTNAEWSGTIQNDMKTIPSLCVSVKLADLFDPNTGIYANAEQDGYAWERPISLELIDPNLSTNSFSELCGIRIRGGFSRDPSNPKHAFRIFFRKDYDKGSLDYPLFGPLPAQQSIDKFDIRCDENYSWSFGGDRANECFMRDNFSRAAQMDVSGQGTRGTYYHLYINGVYWGLYNTEERPEATFGAWYFGGNKDDYDAIKTSNDNSYDIEATDGNLDAWTRLWKQCAAGLSTNAAYYKIQGLNPDGTPNPNFENLIEIDQLIDYMLVIYYGGNLDSPISEFLSEESPNNIYFLRDRNGNAGFRNFTHDAEHTLLNVNENRLGPWPAGDTLAKSNPQWVCQQCMANAEFRLKFADHVRKHFFDNGALTPTPCLTRFATLQALLDRSVVSESARWGDAKTTPACTRDDWLAVCNNIIANYFPYRTQIVINQFMAAGLYPALSAPQYNQYGGNINSGFVCTVTNPNTTGRVYYTVDGSDPRAVGGGIASTAVAGGTLTTTVTLNGTTTLNTRVFDGTNWSALTDSTFTAPQDFSTLKVTEIMYNPPDYNGIDGQQFEFIEMKNTGTVALNLSGAQFVSGIGYTFPAGSVINPGQLIVLCDNPTDFAMKYPNAPLPYGTYTGQLSNSGATITLNYSTGVTIFSFTYNDAAPWPVAADGLGFSIVPYDPATITNFGNPQNWRASANPGGSPGVDDPTPTILGTALINEALTHIDAGGHEFIELYNPGTTALDVTGWYLTDDRKTPMKFKIPSGSVIQPGNYLTFNDTQFDPNPGVAPSFKLDQDGEEVFIFSADQVGLNLTGYSHGFTFEAADDNVSFGRYVISTGDEHFVAQVSNTPGTQNTGPRVGPVVFNEVMYQPASGGDEFIELLNITTNPVNLYDPANPANTWQITGINFVFPQSIQIPAQGLVLVVPIAPATFRTKYNVPAAVQILGPYTTPLADTGMTIELQKPGTPDSSGVPYVQVDWLSYTNATPWPLAPAGNGPSLTRINPLAYGNDPINWTSSTTNGGSPGTSGALTPAAPTGLTLTVISSTQINLAWTDNALNETSYTVQRSPDGQTNWATIAPLSANIVNYPDINLSPANTYYYRVYCSNSFGDSPFSNIANAQTLTPPAPSAPQALVVTTVSQSKLSLEWDIVGVGETGFKVERSADGITNWTQIGQSPAEVATYLDTGLTPSTLYYYRVRAFNAYGNSDYCTVAQGMTTQARVITGRVNGPFVRGHSGSVFVDMSSAGGENSVAFSLTYDPTLLANPVVLKGSGAGSNTTLTPQLATGSVGATVAFVDASSYGPGVKTLVEVQFTVLVSGQAPATTVQFSNTPVALAVLDYTAAPLEVNYQNVSPTINANTPPVAANGTLTATEDLPASGTLSATDAENDALTYSVVTQATKGTVTITNASTGAFTYTPVLYVNGSDSFTFKANDGLADSNTATVTITITPVNHAPVAQNGTLNATEEVVAQGALSATDVDNNTLTFSVVAQAANGTVAITNAATGSYTYTPTPLTYGPDSFTFKANDGTVDSNIATVSITVAHVNHAPVAQNGTLNTLEDQPASATLSGSDPDHDALTYSIVTPANLGTVTITNAATGAYTYTPNALTYGTDSFTFKVNDGTVDSNTATVAITVQHANHAPVAQNGTLQDTEDSAAQGILVASDLDNDALTYAVVAQPANGSVTITNTSTGAYTYTPNALTYGPDSFTFKANDGTTDSNIATISITVTHVNHAPTAQDGALQAMEDSVAQGTLSASDPDNDALTFSVVTQAANGTVTITNTATGAYTYAPNALTYGPDGFTFKANDGTVDSNTATVSVTVAHVNHAPVAQDMSFTTLDSQTYSGTLQASDVDDDVLTFKIITNGSKGVAAITDSASGAFTYTPSGTATGTDTFTIAANDGTVDSAPATVTVTILPTLASFTSTAAAAGNARQNFQFTLTATGTAPIQFSTSALPPGLTLNGSTISGMPTAAGTYSVEVTATNAAGPATQQITVTIINTGDAGNVPPKIVSGPTASVNAAVVGNTVTFTAAATDANGDQLTYTWDFGDGSTGNGASPAHIYANAGTYVVTLTLSDGAATVSSVILIAVNDTAVATGTALTVSKAAVAFNFAPGKSLDSAQISGTVPVVLGTTSAGTIVTVWLGNKSFAFPLSKTGTGGNADASIKLSSVKKNIFASKTPAFAFSLKKQTLFASLQEFGFANTTIASPGSPVSLPIAISLGGTSYTTNITLMYTAKSGKTGSGKAK